ncbi:MAG: GAF and ANTAR domain-containing protein [Acidobacteria bacterium]|nr:GAF and ANTAR domain-containing protein [Acidobacteriota bacterium]
MDIPMGLVTNLITNERELDTLYQISNSINSHLELDEVLGEIVRLVHEVTQGDSCLLYLLDDANRELVLRAAKDPHPCEIGSIRLKIGEGITGWVAQEQKVVAIAQNAYKDSRFKFFANLPEDRFEAFLSAPVTAKNEVIGVINVQHREAHQHSESEIKLLTIIGQQVGNAIENARLFAAAQKRSQQIENILRVSETVSSNLYLDGILKLVVELASEMTHSSVCSIMLVDEEKQELVIKAARASSEEYLKKPPLKIDRSLIGRVVSGGKIITIPDVASEPDYQYPELAKKEGLQSLVSLPLIAKDQVLGVLNCYTVSQHHLTQEETHMLSIIAHQAASAIEKTRLITEALAAKEALETRKLMERAKGILQADARFSEEQAYLRIQQQSRRLRKPMKEIAEAIILAAELRKPDNP